MNELTQKLFDAHVQHELAQLTGANLSRLIDARAAAALAWANDISLEELVPRDYVLGVVQRYVIELRVSGGITELAGEMARLVFRSEANRSARVKDILPARSFANFTEEVIAFDALRRELLATVANSTTVIDVARSVLTRVLRETLTRSTEKLSPTAALAHRLQRSALPELVSRVDNLVHRQLDKHRATIASRLEAELLETLDENTLRSFFEEMWQRISKRPLSESFALVGEQGVEDYVIFCYEFWLDFRRTPYFKQVSSEVVRAFFDKYGAESLSTLIEDMGITNELIVSELKLLLPPMLEQAKSSGFLEEQVREHLMGFYASDAAQALLK